MVVQTFAAGKLASHPQTLTIADADGGAVIEVDLSALPDDARVLAARLFMQRVHVTVPPRRRGEQPQPIADDALVACEVFPGRRAGGKPLEIVGPWLDCLDATEPVRRARGRRLALFVRTLPGWRKDRTYLEVAWEGRPPGRLPQVTGLKAFHRSGQTFLTFREIDDLAGKDDLTWAECKKLLADAEAKRRVRYGVYRHTRPITAETLHEAERIAVVGPLSGWNLEGRNSERAIDDKLANQYAHVHGHWNPFADARVEGAWGIDCALDRFVIADGGTPLPRATGLYVHTPPPAARGGPAVRIAQAFYAVVASVNGTENTAALSPSNSLAQPVLEAPGEPQPVFQRDLPPLPFWNYAETRKHYVRWVGPPYGPRPQQYHNWSVAVPGGLAGGPVALELHLHRDDRSYWRTDYRVEPDSLVVTPYDFPLATWWYGHHEALGTLKSFRQGAVHNYTERRVLWFLRWAMKKWPVDPARVILTAVRRSSGGAGAGSGNSGAATNGAARLALRHPELFNLALIGYDVNPDYTAAVPDNCVRIWGKPEWNVPTDTGDGKAARSIYEELDLVRIARALPPSAEPPLITMSTKCKGPAAKPLMAFTNALLEKRLPIMFLFNYWPGPKLIPISARGTWPAPMIRLDVRRDRPLPAFRAMTLRKKQGYFASIPDDETAPCGDINLHFRWGGAVETPRRVEMNLWADRRWGRGVTTDVTIRRLAKFRPGPGDACQWSFKAPKGPDRRDEPTDQSGRITIAPDGLLTIPALKIQAAPGKLVVTR